MVEPPGVPAVLTRGQGAVTRTSNGLAVREAGLQRIGQTDVEVEVGQQVVVAAVTVDQRRTGGTNDLEVVVVLPQQRRRNELAG